MNAASVLGGEQGARDRLPAGYPVDAHGTGGIDAASARFLGQRDGTAYWAAFDRASNVCLLTQATASPERTAASCVVPGELEGSGAALRVEGAAWRLDAYLLPDSVDQTKVRGSWVAVSANLVVYTGSAAVAPAITLEREPGAAGAPITLSRLALPAGEAG